MKSRCLAPALLIFVLLLVSACDSMGPTSPSPRVEIDDNKEPPAAYWQAYFPLQIGNAWEYVREGRNGATERWRQTVIGDTTVSGTSYFQMSVEYRSLESGTTERVVQLVRYGSDGPEVIGSELAWHCWGNCSNTQETFSGGEDVAIGDDVVTDTLRTEQFIGLFGSTPISEYRYLRGVGLTSIIHPTLEEETRLAYARIDDTVYGVSEEPSTNEQAEEWKRWMPLEVGNIWEYTKTFNDGPDTLRYRMSIISDTTTATGQQFFGLQRTDVNEDQETEVRFSWVGYDPIARTVVNLEGRRTGLSSCGNCRGVTVAFDGDKRTETFDSDEIRFLRDFGLEFRFSPTDTGTHTLHYSLISGEECGISLPPAYITANSPSLMAFAPLELGAVWEYEWQQIDFASHTTTFDQYRITVVGDTTIAGRDYFSLELEHAKPDSVPRDGPNGTFVFDSTSVISSYLRFDPELDLIVTPDGPKTGPFHGLCNVTCSSEFGPYAEERVEEVRILDSVITGLVRSQHFDSNETVFLQNVGVVSGWYPAANESLSVTYVSVGGLVYGQSRDVQFKLVRSVP